MTQHAPSTPPPARVALRVVGDPPATRGECDSVQRPCKWTQCRHHLLVESRGSTRGKVTTAEWNPSLRVHPAARGAATRAEALARLPESCALDVADRGEHQLHEIANMMGITKERTRQIEFRALRKLAFSAGLRELAK